MSNENTAAHLESFGDNCAPILKPLSCFFFSKDFLDMTSMEKSGVWQVVSFGEMARPTIHGDFCEVITLEGDGKKGLVVTQVTPEKYESVKNKPVNYGLRRLLSCSNDAPAGEFIVSSSYNTPFEMTEASQGLSADVHTRNPFHITAPSEALGEYVIFPKGTNESMLISSNGRNRQLPKGVFKILEGKPGVRDHFYLERVLTPDNKLAPIWEVIGLVDSMFRKEGLIKVEPETIWHM